MVATILVPGFYGACLALARLQDVASFFGLFSVMCHIMQQGSAGASVGSDSLALLGCSKIWYPGLLFGREVVCAACPFLRVCL